LEIGIVGCGNAMDGAYMPVVERPGAAGKARWSASRTVHAPLAAPLLKKWRIPRYFNTLDDPAVPTRLTWSWC